MNLMTWIGVNVHFHVSQWMAYYCTGVVCCLLIETDRIIVVIAVIKWAAEPDLRLCPLLSLGGKKR